MPDSSPAAPFSPPSALPAGVNTPALAVAREFAGLPTLEQVIQHQLATAIGQRYPSLRLDLAATQLATPNGKQWFFRPLLSVVHDYLGGVVNLDFSDIGNLGYYLTDNPPRQLKLPGTTATRIDMKVIEGLIKELNETLPIGLQNAIGDYWRDDSRDDRWRWLADMLMDTLRIAALRRTDLDDQARDMLDQFIGTPDREQRSARHGAQAVFAYCLEATLRSAGRSVTVLGPELVLTRPSHGTSTVLLCNPGGQIEAFTSMDALTQAWGQRQGAGYRVDDILIRRYEPDANAFDHEAALLLNRQLEQLGALSLPATQGFAALQAEYRRIVDPAQFFADSPTIAPDLLTTLRPQLPAWLQDADSATKAEYGRYSLTLASAKQRAGGRTFLSGIKDIKTFTADNLRNELRRDALRFNSPAEASALDPDQLELTFSVAAGYPGTVGVIQHERMGLTELAVNNLSSRPKGQMRINHRQGLPLPSWLTPDYVTGSGGLIERVDIGRHYPGLLQTQLLGDDEQAREREVLFADQVSVQLPMLALELSLQHASGMTRAGARRVAALTARDVADQQDIVIRHLALSSHPGAHSDQVANMYIIEARNIEDGPHILYRPLYREPLREFHSRAALFDAIAEPGELQSSVLLWLDDSARPIYANNGFHEPHYLRFGQGDEFSPVRTPEPATLSVDGLNDELHQCLLTDRLMQYLYSSNAQALVAQADRTSVSNSESRWQVLLEGGGLLFGSVLYPLLRGPLLLTAWLATLYAGLEHDVQGQESTDPQVRELATVDLLLNLGLALLEGPPLPTVAHVATGTPRKSSLPLPPHVAEQWPVPAAPHIHQGAVALPGVLLGADTAPLDFSFAHARQRLTASQRARLAGYKAQRPRVLPAPILHGPRKGLYVVDNLWHALVDGQWYQVELEPGNGAVIIVDSLDSARRGPHLRTDGQGTWTLDTRLRLRGGMPPRRIAEQRRRKAQRVTELEADYAQFLGQQATQNRTVEVAQAVMESAQQDTRYTDAQRADTRRRFETALEQQTRSYQKILEGAQERRELDIPLSAQTVAVLLENSVNNARKLVVVAEADRQALYRANSKFTVQGAEFDLAVMLDPEGHEQFIKALLDINERSIHWLQAKDRHLNELLGQGTPGAQAFTRLTEGRPQEISALAIQDLQIRTLKLQVIKEDAPAFQALDAIVSPLSQHVRTHSELNTLELTAGDRVSVLDSLVEHYGRALDALQGLGIVAVQAPDRPYSNRLFKLIEALYLDVTRRLADEIKPVAQPRERRPGRPPTAPGRPQKKVIRTRKKGTFIGDLKPAGSTLPIEVVEVRSEDNDQLLSMYSQKGEVWDEILQPAAARPPSAVRSLNLVKGEARKLLATLDEHLRRGNEYRRISRHPEEVQEFMQHQSDRFNSLATELDQAIQALPEKDRNNADRALVTHLLEAGARLTAKGDELRLQLCLDLPPTHANLEYLIEQKQVGVARYGERVPLSGERRDFIQEYALTDPQGKLLWYAHFHYANADTPKADYTVAHLKTKEQRKQSYYSLLAKADNPQAVVNVHRGLIGKALAERWFLPLAS